MRNNNRLISCCSAITLYLFMINEATGVPLVDNSFNLTIPQNASSNSYQQLESFDKSTSESKLFDEVCNVNILELKGESAKISWMSPCFSNKSMSKFIVTKFGMRLGYSTDGPFSTTIASQSSEIFYNLSLHNLKPDYNYNVEVQGLSVIENNKNIKGQPHIIQFRSPSATDSYPPKPEKLHVDSCSSNTANIQIPRFSDRNGKILYYAVLVGGAGNLNSSQGLFNCTNDWPPLKTWEEAHKDENVPMYETSPMYWNPFNGNQTTKTFFIIGKMNCVVDKQQQPDRYCNGPLKPSKSYDVMVRAFTSCGYTDTEIEKFTTSSLINTYLIMYTIIGVIVVGMSVASFYLMMIKRHKESREKRKIENKICIDLDGSLAAEMDNSLNQSTSNGLINVDAVYCEFDKLKKDSSKIKHSMKSGAVSSSKSKNRYSNVLPYDYNRVVLNDSQDDYINASKIDNDDLTQAFIATQGPKGNTISDFWSMVISYNISVIVMLCKIIEQKKVKCDVYYPEAGQKMQFGDCIVYCIQRYPHKCYIIRDLILVKNGRKYNISHFQYLSWPDFGVPSSPKNIIDFCKLIQKAREPTNNSGPILVHCSAGVGRTGTFITLYKMTKMKTSSIDIYDVVSKLRAQRMGMVQTKEQYYFIHVCLEYLKKSRID